MVRRMLDPLNVFLGLAVLTIVLPAIFLVVVLVAAVRRRRGEAIGPRLAGTLALTGGLSLGTFLLIGSDLVVDAPIIVAALLLLVGQWRRGHRVLAGLLLGGTALPWAILWGIYAIATLLRLEDFEPVSTWLGFGLGAVPAVIGLAIVLRGDPAPAAPDPAAPAGRPGSRSFGSIAAAIREPGLIGPFGMPELAVLVTIVISWLVIPFLLPSGLPAPVPVVVSVVVGALVATEAYIRAMPARSRRAFEAFSWLGEAELAEVRRLTGGGVPSTARGASRWLASHPARPADAWFRVEVMLLAGRAEEARALADAMAIGTPEERFQRAATRDLADWRAGGEGNLAEMEAAAAELEPPDGDERLRAEVAIATARVRRRMADGRSAPGDALEPLLEVRERLGRRADGQVGRAFRRRMLPLLLAVGLVVGVVFRLLSGPI
jgi:hypothetical protein